MPKETQTNQPGEISLDEQLKLIELEERKQALESRKLNDELVRLQLADKRKEVETLKNNKERGRADAEKAIADLKEIQARCNHHTGGDGAYGLLQGQGDPERPTSIGAQVFLDDRIRLMCQRCRAVCWSDEPDRAKWSYWVNLWRRSVNKQMMVIGGPKQTKQPQIVA